MLSKSILITLAFVSSVFAAPAPLDSDTVSPVFNHYTGPIYAKEIAEPVAKRADSDAVSPTFNDYSGPIYTKGSAKRTEADTVGPVFNHYTGTIYAKPAVEAP